MRLDHERLAALETEFSKIEEGLELPHFIWLLQCAIPHPPNEKIELVNGLTKLFYDIDINGDQRIEWSEFTQYIVDAVLSQQEEQAQIKEQDKKQLEEDTDDLELLAQRDKLKIEKAYSQIVREYTFDSSLGESINFNNPLNRLSFSAAQNRLFILEKGSTKVKVADLNLKLKGLIDIPKSALFAKEETQVKGNTYEKIGEGVNVFILDICASDPEKLVFDI